MLEDLYRRGIGLVDAIKVVRLVDGASLWEVGHAVTAHPLWAAARPRTRQFTLGIPSAAPMAGIAAVVGPALGVSFRARDSLYYGGQYFLAGRAGAEEIRIYRNYDPQDRAPVYADATDCPTLIAFSGTARDPADSARALSDAVGVACRVVRSESQDAMPQPGGEGDCDNSL